MRTAILLCITMLLTAETIQAKIYKWTDHHGRMHFSDNIAAVPEAYREQVEERKSSPVSQEDNQPSTGTSQLGIRQIVPRHHKVPLYRVGNAMLVDVTLDGFAKSRLILDTGASLTVIPTRLAKRLSLKLDEAPTIPLQSASGTFLAPLTKVRSLTVGSATVRDVEVVVHDIVPGGDNGLLGMSFLDNFQVTMNTENRIMILSPLTSAAGQARYGGHSRDWWRRKFRFYRRQINVIETYLSKRRSPEMAKTLRYFRAELATLERNASLAAVPRAWRY